MDLSKKHNIELFDNISYIVKFISETSNIAMEDGQVGKIGIQEGVKLLCIIKVV
jgi:hypothetical protein